MFCKVCGNSVEDVMFCEDGICLNELIVTGVVINDRKS